MKPRFIRLREKGYRYIFKSNYLEIKEALKDKEHKPIYYFHFERRMGTTYDFAKLSAKYRIPIIVETQTEVLMIKNTYPYAIVYSKEDLRGRVFDRVFIDARDELAASQMIKKATFKHAYVNFI
jgi:hypothetical protein